MNTPELTNHTTIQGRALVRAIEALWARLSRQCRGMAGCPSCEGVTKYGGYNGQVSRVVP